MRLLIPFVILLVLINLDFSEAKKKKKSGGGGGKHHKNKNSNKKMKTVLTTVSRAMPTKTIMQTVIKEMPAPTAYTMKGDCYLSDPGTQKNTRVMPSDLESLIEFGFPEYKAKKALNVTNNSGLQAALDWLEVNGDNEEAFKESSQNKNNKKETCLKCNQCGKMFKSVEQAELHAARTLHDDFIESELENGCNIEALDTDPTATAATIILTEEQKAARLAELREKVALKRAAREKEAKESEALRKASAKELEQIRRDLQAKEMKKLAEERRMEKIADKRRREEILKQIEEDRENKKKQIEAEKAKLSGINESGNADVVNVNIPTVSNATATSSTARIQIKLPAPNAPLKLTLESSKLLKDLKNLIRSEYPAAPTKMELMQTFPTRVFGKEDDDVSLGELGLSPSASLILK